MSYVCRAIETIPSLFNRRLTAVALMACLAGAVLFPVPTTARQDAPAAGTPEPVALAPVESTTTAENRSSASDDSAVEETPVAEATTAGSDSTESDATVTAIDETVAATAPGEDADVTAASQAEPDGPVAAASDGTLVISKVDETSQSLPGACFFVYLASDPASAVGSGCDVDDGASDGTTVIEDLAPGDYLVLEVVFPSGYAPSSELHPVTILDGQDTPLTIQNHPGFAVVISKVDENTLPLAGACFSIDPDPNGSTPNAPFTEACDGDDGADDGTTTTPLLIPGDYLVSETVAPAGYPIGVTQPVTIVSGQDTHIVYQDLPGFNIVVSKVNEDDQPLAGSCFSVYLATDPFSFVGQACDADDGADDGAVTIGPFPSGDYLLDESTAPDGYLLAAEQAITIPAGQDVPLTIQDLPLPDPTQTPTPTATPALTASATTTAKTPSPATPTGIPTSPSPAPTTTVSASATASVGETSTASGTTDTEVPATAASATSTATGQALELPAAGAGPASAARKSRWVASLLLGLLALACAVYGLRRRSRTG
jgi:hypothetical protein